MRPDRQQKTVPSRAAVSSRRHLKAPLAVRRGAGARHERLLRGDPAEPGSGAGWPDVRRRARGCFGREFSIHGTGINIDFTRSLHEAVGLIHGGATNRSGTMSIDFFGAIPRVDFGGETRPCIFFMGFAALCKSSPSRSPSRSP